MVGFVIVFSTVCRAMKRNLQPKRAGALTQTAKEIIALLVAMVVLAALGVTYAANNYSASKGGTIRVRTIPSSRKGSMGW
jgi:hypothetical protein